MYSDHFWLCLEGLAIAFDGKTDEVLAQYERAWLKWYAERRAEIRKDLATPLVLWRVWKRAWRNMIKPMATICSNPHKMLRSGDEVAILPRLTRRRRRCRKSLR